MEPDLFIGHVHLAIETRATKVQGIALPFAAQVIL